MLTVRDHAEAPALAPSAGSGATRVAAGAQGHETEKGAEETPEEVHHLLLVPVAELNRASMRALAYAASLQQPVLALHLSPTKGEAERFGDNWRLWGDRRLALSRDRRAAGQLH